LKEFRKDYHYYLKRNPLKKSKRSIKQEIMTIRNYWGLYPYDNYYHYFRYKLYEKDLSENQILDYIPPFYFYNIYWEKRHIGLNKSLYESKFFQYQLLIDRSIPIIESVAAVKKGVLIRADNNLITIDELIEMYLVNEDDALFFKPEYGRGGTGIVLISRRNHTILFNNRPISIDKILPSLSKDEDYLIQERFIQSKEMSEINKYSVNTLRIYTQTKGDKIVVPACILRMGVRNSFVDNFAQGGLINIIDVETGNLSEYAQTNKVDKNYYEHPTSHFIFKNSRIDRWQEIKFNIIKYAGLINECKDLGWDVAIGDTEMKILEINVQYGLDIQLVYGGMRKILGVSPDNTL
jgi:hypothetical protein